MSAITDKTVAHLEEFWNTYETVNEELIKRGLGISARPTFEIPVITTELLTTLDDREYTRVYGETTQWNGHLQEFEAHVSAQLLGIDANLSHMAAAIRVSTLEAAAEAGEKKPTPGDLKDAVQLDPNWIRMERWRIHTKQMELILSAKLKTVKNNLQLISRQVEIRRQEKEQFRIEENMPTRGYSYRRD